MKQVDSSLNEDERSAPDIVDTGFNDEPQLVVTQPLAYKATSKCQYSDTVPNNLLSSDSTQQIWDGYVMYLKTGLVIKTLIQVYNERKMTKVLCFTLDNAPIYE